MAELIEAAGRLTDASRNRLTEHLEELSHAEEETRSDGRPHRQGEGDQ